jgi:DNA repair protein RadC
MRLKKGSKEAKEYMASIRAKKSVSGWQKGSTHMIEQGESKKAGSKNIRVTRRKKADVFGQKGTFKNFAMAGYQIKPEIIIGSVLKANQLKKLAPEVKIRVNRGKKVFSDIITSSKIAANILKKYISKDLETREVFFVIYTNQQNRVLGVYVHTTGGIAEVTTDVRLILAGALLLSATGFVLAHNHPSGNLTPSNADKIVTENITNAAKIHNLRFLDHIILTKNEYFSFQDGFSSKY